MKIKSYTTGLALLAVIASLIPAPVRASGNGLDGEKPVRLYASERFGPIGSIKLNSLTARDVSVDGRRSQGETAVWGGELIRVLDDRRVRVAFDSLGEVTLSRGATVRFIAGRGTRNDSGYDVLIASLEQGSLDLKLNRDAGAYIEAAGSTFTAEPGASFGVRVRDARASLIRLAGDVSVQDQPVPQDVKIRLVDELGRPVSSGSQLSVRARSTRQVQVQVTDQNDKPLPDLPVLFSLGNPCLGSLGLGVAAAASFRQKTDKRGIAAVPFVAGAAKCAASILIKVEGTNASVSVQTSVVQSKGFLNTQNTLIIVGVAAAAGIAAGLVVANSGSSEPIRAVPPPNLKP
jgi:hypothetical protein